MKADDFKLQFPLVDIFKNKQDVNIKFFAGMIPNKYWNNRLWINPSSWFIKCYYDLNGKFPSRLNWSDPQLNDLNVYTNDLINIVINEKLDIICLGLYPWNHYRYIEFGRKVKELFPKIVIIVGGPEIDAHRNPDSFWSNHEFADIVVYGDGEIAFKDLIDSMIDSTTLTDEVHNIIFKKNDVNINCGYKRFDDKNHKLVSPYIHNKESIERTIKDLKQAKDLNLLINWEFTRGCPFQCSFCDWSSGLHHKTYRKTYDFQSDLEFFSSIDLQATWIDANIGIFKEDEEIVDKGLELQKLNPEFRLYLSNYSKVKKETVYKFIEKIERFNPGKEIHTIAIQDINESVLQNISRPDIPWREHKEILLDFKKRYPSIKLLVETMIGLPGQTTESYKEMLLDFTNVGIDLISGGLFNLLPNSPASSLDYQKQFDLKFNMLGYMHSISVDTNNIEDIKNNLNSCSWTKSNFIVSTLSASFEDLLIMIGMTYFYNHYSAFSKQNNWPINSKNIIKILNNKNWLEFGKIQADFIHDNSKIFGNSMIMVKGNDMFYSFNRYFSDKNNWVKIIQ